MNGIELALELTDVQAYALAELCKRLHFADARAVAVDDEEAYAMLVACDLLREALARLGYAVR